MQMLGELSLLVVQVEETRARASQTDRNLEKLGRLTNELEQLAAGAPVAWEPSDDARAATAKVAEMLLPGTSVTDMEPPEMIQFALRAYELMKGKATDLAEQLLVADAQLRDTLQTIADATDEQG